MKVGVLGRDPGKEAGKLGIGGERGRVGAGPGQFLVGEGRVEGAVADRVHRPRLPPPARLGNGMMLLDASTERAGAEPAGLVVGASHAEEDGEGAGCCRALADNARFYSAADGELAGLAGWGSQRNCVGLASRTSLSSLSLSSR